MEKLSENSMRAVQYSSYGGGAAGLKHVEIPIPIPKKGEFLVKVEAASVNPVDWKISKGKLRPFLPAKLPCTPGTDIAGEVVSVGASVKEFAPGDKVVCWLDLRKGGSLAEYAVAVPKFSAKRAPSVSAVDGACIPIAGLTALQSLRNSGVNIGGSYTGNILITAAAGGVGLYALQLAKLSGAHVTTTVGERNIELIKGLGADEVIDYKTPEGSKLLSPSGRKYDVVINCATGVKWSTIRAQLSSTGHVQELTPSPAEIVSAFMRKLFRAKQKRSILLLSPTAKDLALVVNLVGEKKVQTFVDSKFPLEKAEAAWAKSMEGHATGKVVVTLVNE